MYIQTDWLCTDDREKGAGGGGGGETDRDRERQANSQRQTDGRTDRQIDMSYSE